MPLTNTDKKKLALSLADQEKNFVALATEGEDSGGGEKVYYVAKAGGANPTRSPTVDLIQELNERSEGHHIQGLGGSETILVKTDRGETLMDKGIASHNRFKILDTVNAKQGGVNTPHNIQKLDPVRWGPSSLLNVFRIEDRDIGSQTPNAGVQLGSETENQVRWMYFLAVYSILAGRISDTQRAVPHGKNVGAILTDNTGRVLSFGLNTSDSNSTGHAEVNCLQAFFYNGGGMERLTGGFLFTSHQPCEMCAGMILTACPGDLKAYYGQEDRSQNKKNFGTRIVSFDQSSVTPSPIIINLNSKSSNAMELSPIRNEIGRYFSRETLDMNEAGDRVVQHLKTLMSSKGIGF